eukprot:3272906-Prymnesium_polylepis.1
MSKLAAEATAAEQGVDEEKLQIDMPPSWVTRLHVPRENFQARCPAGKKQVVYRKGILEKFAPYSREDGLVEQVTIFKDVAREEVRRAPCLAPPRLAPPRRLQMAARAHRWTRYDRSLPIERTSSRSG